MKPACCCTEKIMLISVLCLSIEMFHFIELVMVFHLPLCVKPKIVIYQFEKNCPYPDFIPQTIPLLPISPIKQSWPSCLFIYSAHRVRVVHVLQKMCWLPAGYSRQGRNDPQRDKNKTQPGFIVTGTGPGLQEPVWPRSFYLSHIWAQHNFWKKVFR